MSYRRQLIFVCLSIFLNSHALFAGSDDQLSHAQSLLENDSKAAIESLANISASHLDNAQKVRLAWLNCRAYLDVGKSKLALAKSDLRGISAAVSVELVEAYICRSKAQKREGELEQAKSSLAQAMRFAGQLAEVRVQAQVLLHRGDLWLQLNRHDKAFADLHAAYDLVKNQNVTALKHEILNSLATVYYNTGRLDLAETYYKDLVAVAEEAEEPQNLAIALFNLGHAYSSQEKFAQANLAFERSLKLSYQVGDLLGAGFTLKAWGEHAVALNEIENAKSRLQEALRIFVQANDQQQAAAVHRHLGDIAVKEKRYEAALDHYRTAVPVLKTHASLLPLMRSYRGLAEVYSALGNYESAYLIHQAYTVLMEENLLQQNEEITKRLQAQFETQRLADENQQLELLNQQQQVEIAHDRQMMYALTVGVVLAVIIIVLLILLWRKGRLHAQKMEQLATVDELTQISNRRTIMALGETEWNRSMRFKRPLSCLMFDIDHFKSINDTYGHGVGDEVIKGIAMDVQSELRKTDAIGRIGGEEYLVIATESDIKQAGVLAERIREAVESTTYDSMPDRQVTISIGVAQIGDEKTLADLIQHADEALYRAKQLGRNRVEAYPVIKPKE